MNIHISDHQMCSYLCREFFSYVVAYVLDIENLIGKTYRAERTKYPC